MSSMLSAIELKEGFELCRVLCGYLNLQILTLGLNFTLSYILIHLVSQSVTGVLGGGGGRGR
jgi:hypothetical protein